MPFVGWRSSLCWTQPVLQLCKWSLARHRWIYLLSKKFIFKKDKNSYREKERGGKGSKKQDREYQDKRKEEVLCVRTDLPCSPQSTPQQMEVPEETATCGEPMLEQIFLTGLLRVEKPTRQLRRKEKQRILVMDCNPLFPSPTPLRRVGVGRGVWGEAEHGRQAEKVLACGFFSLPIT